MNLTHLNRYQAFIGHLTISLIIFAIILVCITQYWYPGILFDTGNGWKAISLIVGIDLVLGPLLTLTIFNPAKSSLKFDLSVIGLVQILALIYGTWTIYTSRPLAIAYINTSFITFYANADNAKDISKRVNSLNTNQLFYVFNDTNPSNKLNPNQLDNYNAHAKSVPTVNSPYYLPSSNAKELLIAVDPLASSERYIVINKDTGDLIRFTKHKPVDNAFSE